MEDSLIYLIYGVYKHTKWHTKWKNYKKTFDSMLKRRFWRTVISKTTMVMDLALRILKKIYRLEFDEDFYKVVAGS